MTAVGMFAGRGDVVLGYIVCGVAGIILGWYLRSKVQVFKDWRAKRATHKGAA